MNGDASLCIDGSPLDESNIHDDFYPLYVGQVGNFISLVRTGILRVLYTQEITGFSANPPTR